MADKPFGAKHGVAQNNPNEDRLGGEASPEIKDDGLKSTKTPAQIERERMRRRRRRQRRKIMGSLIGSEGEKPLDDEKRKDEDHPRIRKPDDVREKSKKPEQQPVQKPEKKVEKREETPTPEEKETLSKPPEEKKEEILFDEPTSVSVHSFDLVEEELLQASPVEPIEQSEPAEHVEPVEPPGAEELELLPHNDYVPLSETDDDLSFGEPDRRTSVPVGRLHETDQIPKEEGSPHDISGRPAYDGEKPLSHEEITEGELKEKSEPPSEEKAEKDVLVEKQTTAFKIAGFFAEAGKKTVPAVLHGFSAFAGFLKKLFMSFFDFLKKLFTSFKLGYLIPVMVILALGGGGYFAYTQQYHVMVYNYVFGFFVPKPVEHVEVKVDENDLRSFGIATALLFAQNEGSVHDLLSIQIFNADFFGWLKEPKVKGETGISAATFYGELKDQGQVVNFFQEYVKNLQTVQSLYKTDVYAMLDQSTKRDESLFKYLDQLRKSRDESMKILDQIHINLDDLKVSFDSLNPDKTRFETDFFTSLQNLEPEKSDQLLKSFIDVTQKQAALKARNSALSKLVDYYTTALQRLNTRIQVVDKNRDALIQGIKVVDIPGSDLNMIIKATN